MKNPIKNFAATLAFALAANLTKTLLVVLAVCCTSVGALAQGGNHTLSGRADLSVTTIICPPLYQQFATGAVLPNGSIELTTNMPTGAATPIQSYSWKNYYGDNIGSTQTVVVPNSLYRYEVKVIDANGCILIDTFIRACAVSDNFINTVNITQTGNTITFSSVLTGGMQPYTYNYVQFGDGSAPVFYQQGTQITHTYTQPGVYQVLSDATDVGIPDAGYCNAYNVQYITIPTTSACPTGTCVFPGDTDHDGIANLYDVLTLGVNYGSTGAARTDQSLTWSAHEATDFAGVTPTILVNKKHADCNGNGTIDYLDMTAIGLNYNRTHNGVSPTNRPDMTGVPVFIEFEVDTAFLQTGVPNAIYADVFVGNSITQANNLYGMAFSLNYPSAFINPDSAVQVIYDNTSFMGSPNDMLVFGHDLRADGQFDVALTRTNQIGATGNGRICRVKWIITENISGKGNNMNSILTRLMETMEVTLTGLRTNDNQLVPIASQGSGSVVVLAGKIITDIDDKTLLSNIKIYPNPVQNGSLFINAKDIFIQNYQLSNTLGQTLQTENVQQNTTQIDVQNLPSGVYFIRIATDKGALTQKIVVNH